MHEALEIYHRYSDPKTLAFDLCCGTGVTIQAMLRLGMRGIVNDRDGHAVDLAVGRGRNYMDWLHQQNKCRYPALNTRHHVTHDGSDLYKWHTLCLQPDDTPSASPTCLVLPQTNYPRFLKQPMSKEDFQLVHMSGWLCWLVVYVL